MFFDPKPLDIGGGFAKPEPVNAWDFLQHSFEGSDKANAQASRWNLLNEELDARNDAIFKATGKKVEHPLYAAPTVDDRQAMMREVEDSASLDQLGRAWSDNPIPFWTFTDRNSSMRTLAYHRLRRYEQQLADLEREFPDHAGIIQASRPPSMIAAERAARAEQGLSEAQESRGWVSSTIPGSTLVTLPYNFARDPAGALAFLVGGIAGQYRSPLDLMGFVVGGAAGSHSKSILKNAMINAGVNAAWQTGIEPFTNVSRAGLGLETGLRQSFENVVGAAAMGALIDPLVRVPVREVRRSRGAEGLGGYLIDAPPPPPPKIEPPIPVDPTLVERVAKGEPEALREAAKVLGIDAEPAARAALEVEIANARTQADYDAIYGPGQVDSGEAIAGLARTIHAIDGDGPPVVRAPDPITDARAILPESDAAREVGSNQHADKYTSGGKEVIRREVDLKTLPLERDLARVKAEGQLSRDMLGQLMLYERADGRIVVLDGQRRAALAQAAPETDIKAPAIVLKETAGWSLPEARAEAMRENLRQGDRTNPIEIARAIRDMPGLIDKSVEITAPIEMARALAKLSEDAFALIERGEADPRHGVLVADHVADPMTQAQILRDLQRLAGDDVDAARAIMPDLLPPEPVAVADALLGVVRRPEDAEMPLHAGSKIDDPGGAEAKKQSQLLEQNLSQQIADAKKYPERKAKALEKIDTDIAKLMDEIAAIDEADPKRADKQTELREALARKQQIEEQERPALTAQSERLTKVQAVIDRMMKIVPDGVEVKLFSSVDELPTHLQESVLATSAMLFKERVLTALQARSRMGQAHFAEGAAMAARLEGIDGFAAADTIWIAAHAVKPEGRMAHETLHALIRKGLLTPEELSLLAERGKELGLLPPSLLREYLTEAQTRAAALDPAAREAFIRDFIDEEYAAHLVEAHANGRPVAEPRARTIIERLIDVFRRIGDAFKGQNARTPEAVIDLVLSGEAARRQLVRRGQVDPAELDGPPSRYPSEDEAQGGPMYALSQPESDATVLRLIEELRRTHGTDGRAAGPRGTDREGRPGSADRRAQTDGGRDADAAGGGRAGTAASDAGTEGAGPTRRPVPDHIARLARDAFFADRLAPAAIEQRRLAQGFTTQAWHGTATKLFDAPDPFRKDFGFHVAIGKPDAANERLGVTTPDSTVMKFLKALVGDTSPEPPPGGKVMPLWLKVENPLRMPDMGSWFEPDLWDANLNTSVTNPSSVRAFFDRMVMRTGIDKNRELGRWVRKWKDANEDIGTLDEFVRGLSAEMDRLGYDAVIYKNEIEAIGQDSMFVWRPELVRSAFDAFDDRATGEAGFRASDKHVEADIRERLNAIVGEPMYAIADAATGRDVRRSLDELGYYSQALEAARSLKQAKGTPEQMLAQLKNAGVKDAEIEATNLKSFLDGKPSITRDDIIKHLDENRVGLREVDRGHGFDEQVLGTLKERRSILEKHIADLAETAAYARNWRGAPIKERVPSDPKRRAVWAAVSGVSGDGNQIAWRLKSVDLGPFPRLAATLDEYWAVDAQMHAMHARQPKWPSYSLDPSNPTYRETVIHLPATGQAVPHQLPDGTWALRRPDGSLVANKYQPDKPFRYPSRSEAEKAASVPDEDYRDANFRSGHFPEPNIIGHMQTSLVKDAAGKDVFLIDQIQSDWGQKLRDGGVRDEAKIKELKARRDHLVNEMMPKVREAEIALRQKMIDAVTEAGGRGEDLFKYQHMGETLHDVARAIVSRPYYVSMATAPDVYAYRASLGGGLDAAGIIRREAGAEAHHKIKQALDEHDADAGLIRRDLSLVEAELRTAEAAPSGNPLVNTTDQWTNTTLRRAIRIATEAGADAIAIPHGDTVLSYNPGDNEGMRGFYGTRTQEGIVPKNLRKLLEKIDKTIKPERVTELQTSKGMQGFNTDTGKRAYPFDEGQTGFTVLPLSDAVKRSVIEDGQPMFAFAGPNAKTADLKALETAKKLDADGVDRDAIWKQTGWGRRVDGSWTFEISDDKAALTGKDGNRLRKTLTHDELYAAYPQLRNVRTRGIGGLMGWMIGGGYREPGLFGRLLGKPGDMIYSTIYKDNDRLDKMLHESQHGIQYLENTARGGSGSEDYVGLSTAQKNRLIEKERQRLVKKAEWFDPARNESIRGLAPDRQQHYRDIYRRDTSAAPQQAADALATLVYDHLAGEVEARVVEARREMTPEQRRNRPPWHDYDVAEAEQILRLHNDNMVQDSAAVRALAEQRTAVDTPASPALRRAESPRVAELDREIEALVGKGFWEQPNIIDILTAMGRNEPEKYAKLGELQVARKAAVLAADGRMMFAFAGERARTADHNALSLAKRMLSEGADRNDIWTATGWFQGTDKKWRFEIDDSGAAFQVDATGRLDYDGDALLGKNNKLLQNPMDHATIHKAYPDIKDIGMRVAVVDPRLHAGAQNSSYQLPAGQKNWLERQLQGGESFDLFAHGSEEATSMMLHEYQHAIQSREGFSQGARPLFNYTRYWRAAGEVEARAVQARMSMSPEERRQTPPWQSYDVPEDQQIVRFADGDQGPRYAIADRPVTPGLDMSPEAKVRELHAEMGPDGRKAAGIADEPPMFAISRPENEPPDYTPLARRIVAAAQPLLDREITAGPLAFNLAQAADGSLTGKLDAPQAGITISRDADGLVATVEFQGQTYRIDRDNLGAIIGLTSGREIEIGEAITTLIAQTAEQNGYPLDADAIRPIVAQALDAIRVAQDPEAATQAVRETLQSALRQMEPEPAKAKAANDNLPVETPLVKDLQEVQFYEELAMLVGSCKA